MKVAFEHFTTAYVFKMLSERLLNDYEKETPKLVTRDIGISTQVCIEWSEKAFSKENNNKIEEELEILKNKLKKAEAVLDSRQDSSSVAMMMELLYEGLKELFREELYGLFFHSNKANKDLENYLQSVVSTCNFRAL
jgi:ribosomal protein L22